MPIRTEHPAVSVRFDAAAGPAPAAPETARFFVEFSGSPELVATLRQLEQAGREVTTTTIADGGGRDLLTIVEVTGGRTVSADPRPTAPGERAGNRGSI